MLSLTPQLQVPVFPFLSGIPNPPRLFSRPRLLDAVRQKLGYKFLMVRAGPGYGKTALLLDFFMESGLLACWHTLRRADCDAHSFVTHLVDAVARQFPWCGAQARQQLKQAGSQRNALYAAVAALADGLARSQSQAAIILDNFHLVDGEQEIESILDLLLRSLSKNTHLILSGRTARSLRALDITAYGGVGAINTVDLCFTPKEMVEFFQWSSDYHVGEEEARVLAHESEGWILGALFRARDNDEVELLSTKQVSFEADSLDAYLRREVLTRCEPQVREFIEAVCIFRQMNAALCDELLERKDSVRVLASLENHGLFLTHVAAGWYRFNRLFRAFLLSQARQTNSRFADLQHRANYLWHQYGREADVQEALFRRQAEAQGGERADLCPPRVGLATWDRIDKGETRSEQLRSHLPSGDAETAGLLSQPLLTIRGFGPGQVICRGREIRQEEWKYCRPLELFFYLLEHPGTSRAEIGRDLWPDAAEEALDNAFYSAAYQARKALGGRFVILRQKKYDWEPAVSYEYDVARFEGLLAQVDRLVTRGLASADLLKQAVDLYQGDYLESLDSLWVVARREKLADLYRQALLRLGQIYLDRHDAAARQYYEKALQSDPHLEEAIRGVMASHFLAGERGLALRFYHQCSQRSQTEMNAGLSEPTVALYNAILTGKLAR